MFVVMSVGVGPRPLDVGHFVPGSVMKFCVALNVISSTVKSCVSSPILVFTSSARVSVVHGHL